MSFSIHPDATRYGFASAGFGAHTSRTMMLVELQAIMTACPASANPNDFRVAAIEQNVLLKQTLDARKNSFRYLQQLYGFNQDLLIFRVLRELWTVNPKAQPQLALLCALARDPILRTTVELISATHPGNTLAADQCQQAIMDELGTLLAASTLASAGRNVFSTWDQAGYLAGAKLKVRQQVQPLALVTAYALFLAFLNGERGEGIFLSPWCRLLDQPEHVLRTQAEQASQQGWLEYRSSGQITEVTFRHFLRDGQNE
ncbi:MAG: hypothetical protein WCK35_23615 [Chloroflexota bacterium]